METLRRINRPKARLRDPETHKKRSDIETGPTSFEVPFCSSTSGSIHQEVLGSVEILVASHRKHRRTSINVSFSIHVSVYSWPPTAAVLARHAILEEDRCVTCQKMSGIKRSL